MMMMMVKMMMIAAFATPAAYASTNAMIKAKEVAARLFAAQDPGDKRTIIVVGSDTM
jgi:hypothetical protein